MNVVERWEQLLAAHVNARTVGPTDRYFRLVLIGNQGSGKTDVLEAAAQRAVGAGWPVLWLLPPVDPSAPPPPAGFPLLQHALDNAPGWRRNGYNPRLMLLMDDLDRHHPDTLTRALDDVAALGAEGTAVCLLGASEPNADPQLAAVAAHVEFLPISDGMPVAAGSDAVLVELG